MNPSLKKGVLVFLLLAVVVYFIYWFITNNNQGKKSENYSTPQLTVRGLDCLDHTERVCSRDSTSKTPRYQSKEDCDNQIGHLCVWRG